MDTERRFCKKIQMLNAEESNLRSDNIVTKVKRHCIGPCFIKLSYYQMIVIFEVRSDINQRCKYEFKHTNKVHRRIFLSNGSIFFYIIWIFVNMIWHEHYDYKFCVNLKERSLLWTSMTLCLRNKLEFDIAEHITTCIASHGSEHYLGVK